MTFHPTEAADVAEIAGRSVARVYSDVASEYASLRTGAMLVDRSERSRTTFGGAKAREVLTGLVTNDVLALAPGEGHYAAALTPKGKVIADLRLFARAGEVLVDVAPRAAEGWWAMVRKYVNPRLARYEDVSADRRDLSVYGARSTGAVAAALGIPEAELAAMGLFAHRDVEFGGATLMVARVPDLGLQGFTIWVPAVEHDALWDALVAAGAVPGGLAAFEIARIESGRPEWGLDIDETSLAQEANMDALHAISYTKGCYTGQETVARIHFRGHVNRLLRGVAFDSAALAAKAELIDASGKNVGEVRSVAISPRLGGIALAMVRREIDPPSNVVARWTGGECVVRVVGLPFSIE